MSSEDTTVNPDKAAPAKRPLPVLSGEQITVAFRQLTDRVSKLEESQAAVSATLGGLTPDNKENILILANDIRTVHAELHAMIAVMKTFLEADAGKKLDQAIKEASQNV